MARNATTFTGGFGSSFAGDAATDRKRGKQASPLDVPRVSDLYANVQKKPTIEVPAPAPPQLPSIGRAGSNMGPSIDEQVLRKVSQIPQVSAEKATRIPTTPVGPGPIPGAAPNETLLQYYQRLYGQSASEIYNGLVGAGVSSDAAKNLMTSAGIPQGDIDAALAFGRQNQGSTNPVNVSQTDAGAQITPTGGAGGANVAVSDNGVTPATAEGAFTPTGPTVDTTEPIVWNIPASALIDTATVDAIPTIGTEELAAIRSAFDTELQSAIADANRDYVAGQESLQTQGIGAGSPAAYNSAAARLTQDNINSIYDARIANATAKATALANQIISTKTEARARVDDLVKSIDSASYEDLPMIFTVLLIPNMKAAGYATETIQGWMNDIATQGWEDAMRYTAQNFDGSDQELVATLRKIPYPNGTYPTEEDVRGWLNMNSSSVTPGSAVEDETTTDGRVTTTDRSLGDRRYLSEKY